ncbi:MAG TPA: glycosyltransferase family 4 protein, partial [Bacteroidia bacterium]|nr:glycosyltransferase family 4 protein [Bacteroidia bacterium]
DFIKHLAGNPALKVNLVYNGIIQKAPARTKDKWKEELHISEKSKMAIMIANVHSAKDHETAIKAWHLVVKEFALDAILVFAGNFDEKSELYKQLVALIEQLQLKNHILFTGFVADMPGLIQASDICVFSSHREGLPNAVLEPMSYGIPVAATDLPGVREVLGDDYPFISPHKDHKALAANTVLLLQNSEEYQKTAVRNLNRINTLFSVDTMVNNYVSLIEQHA